MNFTLEDIAKAVEGTVCYTDADKANIKSCVNGVVMDSRQVSEGGVFIALKGERADGHSYIGQVFEKNKARLVITEKTPEEVRKEFGTNVSEWGSYILVKNSLVALKQLGKAYREKLTIPVVGITGSVGKTSTKEFIAGVLSQKYRVLYTKGNYNNEIGVPLTLLEIREEHEVAVIEMGISDFGEMTRLSEMAQPDIAVITNIGQCHLENLGTRDGILKAKTEIFTHMNPNGYVCLFGCDDKLLTVSEVYGHKPFYFTEDLMGGENVPENSAVTITAFNDRFLRGSQATMLLNMPEKGFEKVKIDVMVPLPGHHMVINAAAAANVAMLLDLSVNQIVNGIETMKPISGRNTIVQLKDILMIDDCYNANPVSMKSSIDLLGLAEGSTVVILGDMFELGADEVALHASVGKYAADKGVDYIYCVGALSKNMYEAAEEVFENGCSSTQIMYFANKKDLMAGLREDFESGRRDMIPVGSNVLVKASHGMHFEEVVKLLTELD